MPYEVITKKGNSLVLESEAGVIKTRNVAHAKKFVELKTPVESKTDTENECKIFDRESKRLIKMPDRFKNL